MIRPSVIILASLFLVGPVKAEQPLPQAMPSIQKPMTFEEHCAAIIRALGNPWIEPWQKSAIYEKGRNDGCMGTPPNAGGQPTMQQSQQPIAPDLTANGYISGCKGLISVAEGSQYTTDIFGTGMCTGLLRGLALAAVFAEKDRVFCQPASVSTGQAARVLVAYLEARPARLHEEVAVLAMEAFTAAWPCR
jgi:hypothetical protein